jgi:hypothetical protein
MYACGPFSPAFSTKQTSLSISSLSNLPSGTLFFGLLVQPDKGISIHIFMFPEGATSLWANRFNDNNGIRVFKNDMPWASGPSSCPA